MLLFVSIGFVLYGKVTKCSESFRKFSKSFQKFANIQKFSETNVSTYLQTFKDNRRTLELQDCLLFYKRCVIILTVCQIQTTKYRYYIPRHCHNHHMFSQRSTHAFAVCSLHKTVVKVFFLYKYMFHQVQEQHSYHYHR